MLLRSAIKWLLTLTLSLPLAQAVLLWVSRGLLVALGDEVAARIVDGVTLGVGVLWLVSLVGLVIVLALEALQKPTPHEE
jgi:hypothetical protein